MPEVTPLGTSGTTDVQPQKIMVYTKTNSAGNLIGMRELQPGETYYVDPDTGKYTTFKISSSNPRTYDPYLSAGGYHYVERKASGGEGYYSQEAQKAGNVPPASTPTTKTIESGGIKTTTDVYGNVLSREIAPIQLPQSELARRTLSPEERQALGRASPGTITDVGRAKAAGYITEQEASKIGMLSSGTAQFASEKTFKELAANTPAYYTGAKGTLVNNQFKSGQEQLNYLQNISNKNAGVIYEYGGIPFAEGLTPSNISEKILKDIQARKMEETALRESFGLKPYDLKFLEGTVQAKELTKSYQEGMPKFQVQRGHIIESFAYNPNIVLKDWFGGKVEVKPGMRYMRDIFGTSTELPMITTAPKVTEEQARLIRFGEEAGMLGVTSGVFFTTTSALRGATLIQPGDFATISRSLKLAGKQIKPDEYSLLPKHEQETLMRTELVKTIQKPKTFELFRREPPKPEKYSTLTPYEQSEVLRAELVKSIRLPKSGSVFERQPPVIPEYSYLSKEEQAAIQKQELVGQFTKKGGLFSPGPVKAPEFTYLPKEEQEAIIRGEVIKGIRSGSGLFSPSKTKIPEYSYFTPSRRADILRAEVLEQSPVKQIQKDIANLKAGKGIKLSSGFESQYLIKKVKPELRPKPSEELYSDLTKKKTWEGLQEVHEKEIFPPSKFFMWFTAPNTFKEMQDIIYKDITKQPERTEFKEKSMNISALLAGVRLGQSQATDNIQTTIQAESLYELTAQGTRQIQEITQITPIYKPPEYPTYNPPNIPELKPPKIPLFKDEKRKRKAKGKSKGGYFQTFRATPLIEPLAPLSKSMAKAFGVTQKKSKKGRRK